MMQSISKFCQTGSGTTPSRKQAERYYGGKIPWVKSGELRENKITKTNETVTEQAISETSLKLVPSGALLVAMYGATVGRVGLLGIDATTNQAVCHIIPDPLKADTNYMFHALQQKSEELVQRGVGGAQPNISQGVIKETQVYLPPLPEQKRIAAILDQADALIRLRQKSLDRLNQLGQSIFYDMFGDPVTNPMGWPLVKIGDVTNCIVPGRDKPKSFTGNIPWITTGELISLGFTGKKQAKLLLSEVEITKVRAKIIPKNSVLMTCVGDLGVTSIANENMVINQQLHSFQCREMSKAHYLLYAISHQKNWMFQRSTQTTLPYMNKTVCNSIPLQLPPIELQNKFSVRLDSLNKQKSQITRAITKSKKLFLALQDSAFRGEL